MVYGILLDDSAAAIRVADGCIPPAGIGGMGRHLGSDLGAPDLHRIRLTVTVATDRWLG